ncbi:MAG: hypothetical protein NDF54_06710 [archaeon GB-1867-035]|nr:hypothetical protein [Candidatus Culexmicrobium profundum]
MSTKPLCELVVKYMLPALRYLIAKELIENYGFPQISVAKALGLSQAAISYYMNSKRGQKWVSILSENEEVIRLIKSTAKEIAESKENVNIDLCKLCSMIRELTF